MRVTCSSMNTCTCTTAHSFSQSASGGITSTRAHRVSWVQEQGWVSVSTSSGPGAATAHPRASVGADANGRVASEQERTAHASREGLSQGLLVIGILVGLFIWVHGMHGLGAVPPQIDSANHGFFIARIVHTGSIDASKV